MNFILLSVIVMLANFGDIVDAELISCYDGDTCSFNVPGWPDIIGKKISVRIRGYDTPEIRGKCDEEKVLAREARDYLKEILGAADGIVLKDTERGKYFRILAEVEADGLDVGIPLIEEGLARLYDGGARESWCPEE